uniref:G-protein coupled receptors family 3 profile domain-containing protein n=2 Tax=Meloidogyne TaxID=189290 RepID=A0A915M7Z2_MELJA
METINGTLLFRYMMNVSFEDEFQQEISFDESGDPPAWYDILNYVGYDGFRKAGDWKKGVAGTFKEEMGAGIKSSVAHKLKMKNRELMFYDKTSKMPESVCSKPCSFGQRRRQTTACCWICESCAEGEIVRNNLCQKCPFGEWPDSENRTICLRLQHEYLEITASIAPMIAIAFATLGIICASLVILLFLLHNSTPVVKATTRELSYIILGGIVAGYLCSFALLARPSFIACFFSRTLPPIAFASIYSALFTKTNRIARILAGSKKRILTKKPRFLSTFSQVLITWTLVGIQCIIVAIGLVKEFPKASFDENFAPLSDNKSSTCPQHLLHHSPRRVNMQTQTEVSSIAFSNQTTGFGSRITRTFSVIGGVAGSSGGNEERGLKGSPVGKKENKLSVGSKVERFGRSGDIRERKNRRKTLDDDDERILINPTTIGNLLLEEAPEDVLNEPEGRGEIVSEMLAGTIRGLAQTVSRTATSGIKPEELKGKSYSLKQKFEREDDSPSSPELAPFSSLPTRSSIRSAGGRGVNEMHVDFASVIESDKQIKILKNRSEEVKEQKILVTAQQRLQSRAI